MARTTKIGLGYFPLDVDIFNDPKIQLTAAEFGAHCDAIVLRLLCQIYRNGYFLEYTNDEGLLIAKSVGHNCSGGLVTEVVKGLVRRSFFDKRVYEQFNVITSRGIQRRYVEACERRRKVIMLQQYLLLLHDVDIIPKNVTIIGLNVDIGTQKRREEKRREETINVDENVTLPDDFEKFKDDCLKDEMHFVGVNCAQNIPLGLNLTNFPDWMDKFNTWLRLGDFKNVTYQEYRRHFANWIKKQEKPKQSATGVPTKTL